MQFVLDNGIHKVARVTGSQHNLLGIRLADMEGEIKVVPLSMKDGDIVRIDGGYVLGQVRSGLDLVNKSLAKQYSISEVQYLPSDTLSPGVYESLIIELIRKIDSGYEFPLSR